MVSCLHDLFAKIAVNAPELTAIVFEEGSVSYGELNHRSDRTAVYLRAAGVQEGTFVPLCMRRSIEFDTTMSWLVHLARLAELANRRYRDTTDTGDKSQSVSFP